MTTGAPGILSTTAQDGSELGRGRKVTRESRDENAGEQEGRRKSSGNGRGSIKRRNSFHFISIFDTHTFLLF